MTGALGLPLGTAAAPAMAWAGGPAGGSGWFADNTYVRLTVGGSTKLRASNNTLFSDVRHQFIVGTAAAPSFYFATDTDTGLWGAADTVNVTTGGTNRLAITNTSASFAIPVTLPAAMPSAATDAAHKGYVDQQDALRQLSSEKNAVNGYAGLDSGGKVIASLLPAYVDDVLEYANLAAFPGTGTTGVIYVALDTNKTYRWGGSSYTEISPSPGSTDAVPEGSLNKYYTSARALADVTWSTLAGKPSTFTPSTHSHPQSEVTNLTSDLALKAPLADPIFTGNPQAPTPATSDNDTSVATTAYVKTNLANYYDASEIDSQLLAKANLASPTFTGDPKAPTVSASDNDTTIATTAFTQSAINAKAVRYDVAQSLTTGQKTQAQTNIGLLTADRLNRLVNGAFQWSQERGLESTTTASGQYPADQWIVGYVTGASPFAGVFAALSNAANTLRFNASATTDTSIAAADIAYILQSIEGNRLRGLEWGTASAKPIVIRFWGKSIGASLVIGVAVKNDAANRAWCKNITLTSAWQEFVIAVPGDTSGTWPVDTTRGMIVSFCGMAGSNFVTASSETWVATNSYAVSGVGNMFAAINSGFDIRQVGLYLDPSGTGLAPPWEMPDPAQELTTCQRYWQTFDHAFVSQGATSGTSYAVRTPYPVPPRPGCAVSGVDGGSAINFPATPAMAVGNTSAGENRAASATASTLSRYFTTVTVNGRF
jgi:hypothetical protein